MEHQKGLAKMHVLQVFSGWLIHSVQFPLLLRRAALAPEGQILCNTRCVLPSQLHQFYNDLLKSEVSAETWVSGASGFQSQFAHWFTQREGKVHLYLNIQPAFPPNSYTYKDCLESHKSLQPFPPQHALFQKALCNIASAKARRQQAVDCGRAKLHRRI